jgi:hypothetical protein
MPVLNRTCNAHAWAFPQVSRDDNWDFGACFTSRVFQERELTEQIMEVIEQGTVND